MAVAPLNNCEYIFKLSEVSEWRADKSGRTYLQLKREKEFWVEGDQFKSLTSTDLS